ncbi:FUSC family protein [Schnuerera sp. xch1]|uniref:FUSC family protein n=1 Tax=Schnuerera sp. xch1 TaxID=2874283 RepID=UPI001CC04B69|nr:aromatic acid exporter family protein [Schnuerera sp. xch1]MBZ2174858.1 FUSC family protein [Schnuerera sp. xch1]
MKVKKVGMRTVKTALAVSITILISQLLSLNSPLIAGIAAIIAMKTSVSESFSIGKHRMFGTIVGAIIALLFSYIAPLNILSIGIGTLIVIHICNMLGWKKSITISVIVFLAIILNYEEGSRLNYAMNRTLDTFIGLIVGTLINYFIVPPNPYNERFIIKSINEIYNKFKDTLETAIFENENKSLEGLKVFLSDIESNYNILKKDTELEFGNTDDYSEFETIFKSFERIYNHLSVMFALDTSYLEESNRKELEKLFDKKIPPQFNREKYKTDLIFNYHIEKILNELNLIENKINNEIPS